MRKRKISDTFFKLIRIYSFLFLISIEIRRTAKYIWQSKSQVTVFITKITYCLNKA